MLDLSNFMRSSDAYDEIAKIYDRNPQAEIPEAILRRLSSGALKSLATGAGRFMVRTVIFELYLDAPRIVDWQQIDISDGYISDEFWHNLANATFRVMDWVLGDFSFDTPDARGHAHGVMFERCGVEAIIGHKLPAEADPMPCEALIGANAVQSIDSPQGETRGRPVAEWWPDFVAELAAFASEGMLPPGIGHQGQSNVFKEVSARLVARGLREPDRTQTQDAINAVLRRFRLAGK